MGLKKKKKKDPKTTTTTTTKHKQTNFHLYQYTALRESLTVSPSISFMWPCIKVEIKCNWHQTVL